MRGYSLPVSARRRSCEAASAVILMHLKYEQPTRILSGSRVILAIFSLGSSSPGCSIHTSMGLSARGVSTLGASSSPSLGVIGGLGDRDPVRRRPADAENGHTGRRATSAAPDGGLAGAEEEEGRYGGEEDGLAHGSFSRLVGYAGWRRMRCPCTRRSGTPTVIPSPDRDGGPVARVPRTVRIRVVLVSPTGDPGPGAGIMARPTGGAVDGSWPPLNASPPDAPPGPDPAGRRGRRLRVLPGDLRQAGEPGGADAGPGARPPALGRDRPVGGPREARPRRRHAGCAPPAPAGGGRPRASR